MKHYIKLFLLCVLTCVGFISCNEQDLTDNPTYPQTPGLHTWKSTTPSRFGLQFYIINSLNLEGDTVCNVLAQDVKTNQLMTFCLEGSSTYDAQLGVMSNDFAVSPIENLPAVFSVCYRPDVTTATVDLSVVVPTQTGMKRLSQDAFRAAPQKGFPVENTYWVNMDPAVSATAIMFMPENKFMCTVGDSSFYVGSYEWNEVLGSGVLHMVEGDEDGNPLEGAEVKDQSIYLNGANQFVAVINGAETLMKIIEY